MTIEALLVYGATALGGYLLRHFGVGSSFMGAPAAQPMTGAPAAAPAAPAMPVLSSLESLAEAVAARVIARLESSNVAIKK